MCLIDWLCVAGQYLGDPEMLHALMTESDWIGGRICTVKQDDKGRNIITPK